MQQVLGDTDGMRCVAAQLTREDAGRLLAPLCKAAAAFVRALDAAGHEGQLEIWRDGPAMWSLQRAIARIERKLRLACARVREPDGEGVVGLVQVLQSLAGEIDFMRAAGIVELIFDRPAACAGKHACLLGCHRLDVLDPTAFLDVLDFWSIKVSKNWSAKPTMYAFRGSTVSHFILNLFRELGLKTRSGKDAMFPAEQHVGKHKKHKFLWHRSYFV